MPTSGTARPTIISFASYTVDLQQGLLRKNGIKIPCQEQPLQVLAALIERPGELVTREELRRRVWQQDTFLDFDQALNTAVRKIRATLNDDADAPRYIETVPRRGYRFIAPVEQPPLPQPEPTSDRSTNHRFRNLLFAGAGTLLLAVVLMGFYRLRRAGSDSNLEFERLTYGGAELADRQARFTPDGASIVYSVGSATRSPGISLQRIGSGGAQSLGLLNATLLSVSRDGELAVLNQSGEQLTNCDLGMGMQVGTLARVPLGGGGARKLLSDIQTADWSSDGQLAVVRGVGLTRRLEFPVGKVLYQTTGWISSPRFSPSGDAIAFLEHPVIPDDRGSVVIVDRQGSRRILSGIWESLEGLAWSPRGDEVWFAATRSGITRSLYAVTLSGHERRVLSVAGGLSLNDISRDGRVLVSRTDQRLGLLFARSGQSEAKDLSWKDWSIAMDISQDGKQILFDEEGENSGLLYQVGIRPIDGSPPVVLGTGIAQSLSPDGKWALSLRPPPSEQMVLLPVGAGTSKLLDKGPIEHFKFFGARWLPDSRRILFAATEPHHASRCYVQSIEGGLPTPFTKEGAASCTVSPNGVIAVMMNDSRLSLYSSILAPLERGFDLKPGETPAGWDASGRFLYLAQPHEKTIDLFRFDVGTGHRDFWAQLPPTPGTSQAKGDHVVVTPDGHSFAYTYDEHTSDLYVVHGVR